MDANIERKKLNRIKVVLAEHDHTGRWLATQLQKDPVTISKWCTNTTQPDLYTLETISQLLNVPIRELLVETTSND
jgi:transcriptional regulator with XRE-family HTH domain